MKPNKPVSVGNLVNTDVDGAGAIRLEFRTERRSVFSVSMDCKVTLRPGVTLDEASRLFWEAVDRVAPVQSSVRAVYPTDLKDMDDRLAVDYEKHELRVIAGMMADYDLANVKVLPGDQVKGFSWPSHSSTYDVLVINGVGVTGFTPKSSMAKTVEKALKTEPVKR